MEKYLHKLANRDTSLPSVTVMLTSVNISPSSYHNIFFICLDHSDLSKSDIAAIISSKLTLSSACRIAH